MELHRVSGDKRAATAATVKPSGVECQPNAGAPLLRDEKGRREWLENELDMCCQVRRPSMHHACCRADMKCLVDTKLEGDVIVGGSTTLVSLGNDKDRQEPGIGISACD